MPLSKTSKIAIVILVSLAIISTVGVSLFLTSTDQDNEADVELEPPVLDSTTYLADGAKVFPVGKIQDITGEDSYHAGSTFVVRVYLANSGYGKATDITVSFRRNTVYKMNDSLFYSGILTNGSAVRQLDPAQTTYIDTLFKLKPNMTTGDYLIDAVVNFKDLKSGSFFSSTSGYTQALKIIIVKLVTPDVLRVDETGTNLWYKTVQNGIAKYVPTATSITCKYTTASIYGGTPEVTGLIIVKSDTEVATYFSIDSLYNSQGEPRIIFGKRYGSDSYSFLVRTSENFAGNASEIKQWRMFTLGESSAIALNSAMVYLSNKAYDIPDSVLQNGFPGI